MHSTQEHLIRSEAAIPAYWGAPRWRGALVRGVGRCWRRGKGRALDERPAPGREFRLTQTLQTQANKGRSRGRCSALAAGPDRASARRCIMLSSCQHEVEGGGRNIRRIVSLPCYFFSNIFYPINCGAARWRSGLSLSHPSDQAAKVAMRSAWRQPGDLIHGIYTTQLVSLRQFSPGPRRLRPLGRRFHAAGVDGGGDAER